MNLHKVHSLLEILRIQVTILQSFIISVYKYKYKVILEEGPLFWEVVVWVTAREKKSYERVSNSEWLPKWSGLNHQT